MSTLPRTNRTSLVPPLVLSAHVSFQARTAQGPHGTNAAEQAQRQHEGLPRRIISDVFRDYQRVNAQRSGVE